MYTNKCIKCGKEFETKNPKRVICPDCLYPERITESTVPTDENGVAQDFSRGYSAGSGNPEGYSRRYNNRPQNNQNNYRQKNNSFQKRDGNFKRPQKPNQKGNFKRPQKQNKPRPLLINKEQLAQIE